MDLVGIAAVIGAVSGFLLALTGIVIAFRVVSPPGMEIRRVRTDRQTSTPLPPQAPNPGA